MRKERGRKGEMEEEGGSGRREEGRDGREGMRKESGRKGDTEERE